MGKTHFPVAGGNEWAAYLSHYLPFAPIGNVIFVNSAIGSDTTGYGRSPEAPVATVDYAVGLCTTNNDDHVIVAAGHAETITAASAIDFDVAGITVIGLGVGDNKPAITFGTATTATVRINAKNVRLKNFRFVNNIDSLVKFVNVASDYATIEDCDFVTSSTKEALSFINLATTFDYLTVSGCRFEQPTDPAGADGAADTGGIYLVDSEHVAVKDCKFIGNFETACIHNKTTACKYLVVERCYMYQALSGAEPFQMVAAAIGVAKECFLHTPAEVAATEATLFGTLGDAFFIAASSSGGNDGAAGGQGGIIPTTAS